MKSQILTLFSSGQKVVVTTYATTEIKTETLSRYNQDDPNESRRLVRDVEKAAKEEWQRGGYLGEF